MSENNKKAWQGNLNDIKQFSDKVIETPIFIIFAEYLGYFSKFAKTAEEWCEGKIPELFMQKFMRIEAKSIYNQMMKDYTLEEVRYWYDAYYKIIIKEYEDKLEALIK